MAEWEIKKADGKCFGTGQEFQPGQEFFAALVETQQGFERRDYCLKYWQENEPKVYCFWKTRLSDSDEKKPLFIDDEMLMAFFERLAEETDPDKLNFRFVLTLILMRKKKLRYESSRMEDGKEIWTLYVTGQNRTVDVLNTNLSEDQIEQLSTQVGQIMQLDMEDD